MPLRVKLPIISKASHVRFSRIKQNYNTVVFLFDSLISNIKQNFKVSTGMVT